MAKSSDKLTALFETAVEEHSAAVARFARRSGVLEKDRLDVVANVFITAWNRRETFDPRCKIKPWLLGIARCACSNYWQSVRTSGEVLAHDTLDKMAAGGVFNPEAAAIAREERELLGELITWLPAERRDPLLLHLEGCTAEEIAAELGILPNTASARIRLALRDLEDEMQRRRARDKRHAPQTKTALQSRSVSRIAIEKL